MAVDDFQWIYLIFFLIPLARILPRVINNGVRDFNQIQKNIGMDNQELEKILTDLENKGLMKIVKKSGLMGSKVEIHPTENGFKKFYT